MRATLFRVKKTLVESVPFWSLMLLGTQKSALQRLVPIRRSVTPKSTAHLGFVHQLDVATAKPIVSTPTTFTLSLNVSVLSDATKTVNAAALVLGHSVRTMSRLYSVSWHPARRSVSNAAKRLLRALMTTVGDVMPMLLTKPGFKFAPLLPLVHRLMIVDRRSTAQVANAYRLANAKRIWTA